MDHIGELIGSQVYCVHSKLKNRLHVRNIKANLLIRHGLKRVSKTCVAFQPTRYLIENFFDKQDDIEIDKDDNDIFNIINNEQE